MSAPDHILALETLLQDRQQGRRRLVTAAGCFDVLSARLALDAGFEALLVGGDAMALSRYGLAQAQLLSPEALTETLYIVRDSVEAPVIADAADGFGNALHVMATVRSFEFAGASVVQISDSSLRRRDRQDGPRFAVAEMIGKLKAALDARRHCLIGAVVVVSPEDEPAALVDRAAAYVEVGADMIVLRSEAAPPSLVFKGADVSRFAPIGFEWSQNLDPAKARNLAGDGYGLSLHPYLVPRLLRAGLSQMQKVRTCL